jgi:hypothetical protein
MFKGGLCIKIYNLKQADIFIKNKATVIGCGLGNKFKTYLEFEENEIFIQLIKRWMAKEF